MNIVANAIYRHFRGGYYQVIAVAKIEDSDDSYVVIYKEINGKDKIWGRPLEHFEAELDDGIYNPTGQKHRFELVNDFANQMGLTSTDNLVKELFKRQDNPFVDLDLKEQNERIFCTDYVVGTIDKDYKEDTEIYNEIFKPYTTKSSLDEAVHFASKATVRNPCILKRVLYKQDFDSLK